jgi:agmatine/peptidylarginine deiminase
MKQFLVFFIGAVIISSIAIGSGSSLKPIPDFESKRAIALSMPNCTDSLSDFKKEQLEFANKLSNYISVWLFAKQSCKNLLKDALSPNVKLYLVESHYGPWIRDFGPIWVESRKGGVKYLFDLPYHKKDDSDHFPIRLANILNIKRIGKTGWENSLEVGNFQSDENGNCFLTSENDPSLVNHYKDLAISMGCYTVNFLEPLPYEPTKHIDIFMTLLANKKALVAEFKDPEIQKVMDKNYTVLDSLGYILHKVPHPNPVKLPDSETLEYFTYINSVIVDNRAFIPKYDIESDEPAFRAYSELGFDVIGVNAKYIIKRHGSLHCLTHYIF